MGAIADEFKRAWRESGEKEAQKKTAKEAAAAKEKERLSQVYAPGRTFIVAENFKIKLWKRSLIGNKMKDGGKHWITAGGERNITFLRLEKGNLVFSVRWGIGKNYWEMRLTEGEADRYLVPEHPASPSASLREEAPSARTASPAEQLREMKSLLDEGVITPEEFEKFKSSLLG